MVAPSPSPQASPMWGPGLPGPNVAPRPNAPFVVAIIGGVFVFLGGLVELDLLAINEELGTFFGFPYWITALLGLALGPAIIALAILFYHNPRHATVCGSLIIGLSATSFLSFGGGFYIGLVLGLIGGILILVWRPAAYVVGYFPAPPPYLATPGGGTPGPYPPYRTCLKCGRAVVADARFCSYCGNVFG